MNDAIKIARRACDAAGASAEKMESLFDAIERLTESMNGGATAATLAGIGRQIATELAARMDRDETTLMRLQNASSEALTAC